MVAAKWRDQSAAVHSAPRFLQSRPFSVLQITNVHISLALRLGRQVDGYEGWRQSLPVSLSGVAETVSAGFESCRTAGALCLEAFNWSRVPRKQRRTRQLLQGKGKPYTSNHALSGRVQNAATVARHSHLNRMTKIHTSLSGSELVTICWASGWSVGLPKTSEMN